MKIAVPLVDGCLSMHFGHCDSFAIIDMDDNGKVVSRKDEVPPPHEPGVLPVWLVELGVKHVIAGGMGSRAQQLFASNGIQVTVGAPLKSPEDLAESLCAGTLQGGDNVCDH